MKCGTGTKKQADLFVSQYYRIHKRLNPEKRVNIINDDDLITVSGGRSKPGKAPEVYAGFIPDDYAINGFTLSETIAKLNEITVTGV